MELINQNSERILRSIMPVTRNKLRKALIYKVVVDTSRAAQELYDGPFLASLATLGTVQVKSVA